MRIIAGRNKGMALDCPKGDRTRPTLSRVRESLFMVVAERIENARTLDLYAGAGSLGLEALSRGARSAHFVDQSQAAVRSVGINLRKLGATRAATVEKADVWRYLGREPDEPFDLVFVDPPYGKLMAHRTLEKMARAAERWLAPGGAIVAQVGKHDPLESAYGPLVASFSRAYGDTRIDIFEFADPEGE